MANNQGNQGGNQGNQGGSQGGNQGGRGGNQDRMDEQQMGTSKKGGMDVGER
jgi:hypothetical protein